MQRRRTTRREFVRDVGLAGAGSVLVARSLGCKKPEAPADAAPPPAAPLVTRAGLKTFTAGEFRAVEAACSRIVPSDHDPGAQEAGCADYIDCTLAATPIKRQKDDFLTGLASLMRQGRSKFGAEFADAGPERQDEMLRGFQQSKFSGEQKFFDELLVLTMEGFLGDPRHGGNRDRVGWRVSGFAPPFPIPTLRTCSHG